MLCCLHFFRFHCRNFLTFFVSLFPISFTGSLSSIFHELLYRPRAHHRYLLLFLNQTFVLSFSNLTISQLIGNHSVICISLFVSHSFFPVYYSIYKFLQSFTSSAITNLVPLCSRYVFNPKSLDFNLSPQSLICSLDISKTRVHR